MNERHALIVEDSPTMRQLIALALRRIPQLRLFEAPNGAEGLELLKRERIDFILLDLRMPVMDGFTFLQRLEEQEGARKPPVVVITTEGDQASIDRAREWRVADFITKPVQSMALAAKVRTLLDTIAPVEGKDR